MEQTDLTTDQQRILQAVADLEDDNDEPTAHAVGGHLQVDVGEARRLLSELVQEDLVVEIGAQDDMGPRYAIKDRPAPG